MKITARSSSSFPSSSGKPNRHGNDRVPSKSPYRSRASNGQPVPGQALLTPMRSRHTFENDGGVQADRRSSSIPSAGRWYPTGFVGWTHDRSTCQGYYRHRGAKAAMPESLKHFEIPVGFPGDFLRVVIVRDGKRIVHFVVQYFARIDGEDREVIRFDTAHDFAHRDLIAWDGSTIRKTSMRDGIDYATAMKEAIEDLKTNWERHRTDFQRRRP